MPAIADDSGLCISSLNNEPGIYSARWAGKEKDFNIAIEKIEKKMEKNNYFNKSSRKAFFLLCFINLFSKQCKQSF